MTDARNCAADLGVGKANAMEWVDFNLKKPSENEYVVVFPFYISGAFEDEPRHVLRYQKGRFIYYMGDSIHETYGHIPSHWVLLPVSPFQQGVESDTKKRCRWCTYWEQPRLGFSKCQRCGFDFRAA